MNFDTRTVVLVAKRLVELAERPPLFHDRITPAIIARRLDRVLDWLGTGGRIVVADYLRRREVPPPGKRRWSHQDAA